MAKRFKFIPAVYLVLRDKTGRQVLLARRFQTGYRDGYYSMVAGHLEGDEPLAVALVREAKEEAGIVVAPNDLRLVHVMHLRSELAGSTADERVVFYFSTDKYQGVPTIMEPDKCDDMRWFALDNLPPLMIDHVAQALRNIERRIAYDAFGWDVAAQATSPSAARIDQT